MKNFNKEDGKGSLVVCLNYLEINPCDTNSKYYPLKTDVTTI